MDLTVLGTGVTLRLLAVEFHADPGDGGKRCRAGAGGVHRNAERLRRDGFGRFGGVGAVRIVLMQQLRLAERERAETGQAGIDRSNRYKASDGDDRAWNPRTFRDAFR